MNIAIITICYNQAVTIRELHRSIFEEKSSHARKLYLFATSPSALPVCEDLAKQTPGTYYIPYGKNVGVARCWNEGILEAHKDNADVIIVMNDDCWFSSGDLSRLAEAAFADRDKFAITCSGYHHHWRKRFPSHGFACVAFNPIMVDVLGCFDENFFPAYLEDCDLSYRAHLAELREGNIQTTNVHHAGSATIFSNSALQAQNHMTHTKNFEYYRAKWGGINEEEVYTTPFNNPKLHPWFIDPDLRHEPYPGYNRKDQYIVRL